MKDFKLLWKQLAKEKHITATDVLHRCLFKAIIAKSAETYEDRVTIAYNQLRRAFTPITNLNKLGNGMQAYSKLFWASNGASNISSCLETEEEKALFMKLRAAMVLRFGMKETIATEQESQREKQKQKEQYTFIFVRTDLTKEQVAIQSSHATLVLGASLDKSIKPHQLNFVMCGVQTEAELIAINGKINQQGFKTVSFRESDLNNELTAIASYPIPHAKKAFMREHALLKFAE